MKFYSSNPLVSVIIPTRNSTMSLNACLYSIKNQTYKNIEIIIISRKIDTTLRSLQKKLGFFLKENATGKSESRNIGSHLAKGSFLLHVDDDMVLDKKVIEECVELSENSNLKAVAIPEKQQTGSSFFEAITVLEKKIVSLDKYVVAPRFIEKSLFFKLGGFDPHLDPIDDGDLKAKLKKNKIKYQSIKSSIKIVKTIFLKERIVRMYMRGQKQQLFNILHQHSKQLKPLNRLWPYVYFFPLFFQHPVLYISLVCLKTLDLIILNIGNVCINQKDKNYIAEIKNKSIFLLESATYQKEFYENSLGGNYVDIKEKEIVLDLLKEIDKSKKIKVLDIGAGGGRWSRLLLETFPNAKVVALDLSEGMVDNLKRSMESFGNRFSAQIGDMQNLPFTKNSFDAVMSIRAIKYAPNQDKVFSEIHRILKNQGTAVIELPYANTIYSFIRKVNIFGKLSEYVNRIQLRKKEDIEKNLRENKLFIEHSEIHFTVPATFYKKINNRFILKILNLIDTVLSKDVFGRSIFISLRKQQKLRIGVNSRLYQKNETGIPYFIKHLYKTLLKKHKSIEYVFFQTNTKKTLGVTKIYHVPNNIFESFLFDGFFSNKLAVQEKVNIFHGPSNVLPFFKKYGIKYVVTIHDLSFLIFPDHYSRLFNFYYRFIIRRTLHNADTIVAVSYNTKKDIQRFYKIPEEKIKVIYSGINDKYLRTYKTKRLIKNKYFFSISSHSRRKNIMTVLDVMASEQKLRKYKYVIVGLISDKNLQELKVRIRTLNLDENVILFGLASEENLISLYQNAEFFIYPSFYEGFGFPVLEAMACKCPVITSNNSSLVEITQDKTWLINPRKPVEIANKMKEMLSLSKDKQMKLIEKNYLFCQKFTWEKTAEEYSKIFNNL